MEPVGVAALIQFPHESGVTAQGWDLKPWGGPVVMMGKAGSPLPPSGTTVDRGMLRLDVGLGSVMKLSDGDPPPTQGPTGGPEGPSQTYGIPAVEKIAGKLNFKVVAVVLAAIYFMSKGKRRRRA